MRTSIFLLFAAFLLSGLSVSAQVISKGTHTIGSSLTFPGFSQSGLLVPNQAGLTTTTVEEDGLIMDGVDEYFFDQYFIQSGYSYFLADDLSIGADFALAYTKTDFGNSTEYYLSPELRYYLRSPFFLSVAGNMAYLNEEFEFNSLSLSAGYNLFGSSDWAIEPRLIYTHLLGDEIRTIRGEGFMGELSFRYFPGRTTADSAAVESALQKGNFLFGGSGSLNFAQEDFTFIYMSPRAGYFITDHLVLGAGFNYVYQRLENSSAGGGQSSTFSNQALIGNVFARYYVYNGFFTELEAGLMLFNSAKENGEELELQNLSVRYFSARLGYSWFISPALALEPSLRFGRALYSNEVPRVDNVITLESVQQSFGLEFSIHVFLNR